jgi:cell division topological specificity factor
VILLDWFRRKHKGGSAPVARDRLTVLLAHERALGAKPELLEQLRGELVAAICRHITIVPDKVHVKMDHHQQVSTLAIEIEIPA